MQVVHEEAARDITQEPKQSAVQIYGQMQVVHEEPMQDIIRQPKQNVVQIYDSMQVAHGEAMDVVDEESMQDTTKEPNQNTVQIYGAGPPKIYFIPTSPQTILFNFLKESKPNFRHKPTFQVFANFLALSCDFKSFCRRFLDDVSCLQVFGTTEFSTYKCYPKTKAGVNVEETENTEKFKTEVCMDWWVIFLANIFVLKFFEFHLFEMHRIIRHFHYPYPTSEERDTLAVEAKGSTQQGTEQFLADRNYLTCILHCSD